MYGNSLLGSVARRVGPSLLTSRRDDPDAFLRHLQLISTDFITHWPAQKCLFTPYTISTTTTTNITNITTMNEEKGMTHSHTAEMMNDEMSTLHTALCFAVGENDSNNQAHVFEMSILLALLRRPRADYAETIFWDILMDKLKELDFYELLQQHILKVWKMIKEQQCGPEVFRGMRILQLSCDILLLFSQHAMNYSPNANILREFIIIAQEMWVDDSLLTLKRCAIVISVFLSRFPSLLPLDLLCTTELSQDAPCYLAVLAKIPILRQENGENPETLRMALDVVFKTTVYSIPLMAYFYTDGNSIAVVSIVRECFASILYEIFLTASSEFWSYFSQDSLISITEACATYVSLWGSYPSGMQGLQRHIYNIYTNHNSIYAISLVNFYTAAASVYDITLDELEEDLSLIRGDAVSRGIMHIPLSEGFSHLNEKSSLFIINDESPVKKTFRLLSSGCSAFSGNDSLLFLRSGLFLLRALLPVYIHQLGELERLAGCSIKSLLRTVCGTILSSSLDDTNTLEAMYGIISRYHYLLDNLGYLDYTLLLPEFMKGVGLKREITEIASLQLRLYNSFLGFKHNFISPGKVVESLAYIEPGVISRFSLAVPFFIQWLSITQTLLSETSESLASFLTFEESHNKLIHRLCEGIFVIIREFQTGNVFLDSYSAGSLLEEMIRILSLAVLDDDRQDVLATCVITTYGEDTLSACFMLYSLIFAHHANTSLVELTARLLAYVVQHSQEKFFTTMRFHTSTEMKRYLFAGIHRLLQPSINSSSTLTTTTTTTTVATTTTVSTTTTPLTSSSSYSSLNVIRLASLRCLLQYDPASFYYFVVPEEAEKGVTEIPLVGILRSIVKSPDTVILEKAEALELLRALNDVSIPLEEVTSLLSHTDGGPSYCKAAFIAAITNYVCGIIFDEIRLESEQQQQMGKSVERQSKQQQQQQQQQAPLRSPSRSCSVQSVKSKGIVVHSKAIRLITRVGCEALLQCAVFYRNAERELRLIDVHENSMVSEYQGKRDSQRYLISHSRYNTSSVLSNTNNYDAIENTENVYSWDIKLFPILVGIGFLVPQMENNAPVNRMASVLESINRLTASLEVVLWTANMEKEGGSIAPMILEAVLDGITMVEPTVPSLHGLMWDCLNGWLSLARAAAEVLAQCMADSVLPVSTAKLNPFFQNFVKLLNSNRRSITVLSQGLGVLSVFQPSDLLDDATIRQIFELIDDVLEKNRTMTPSNMFFVFISEICATYNRFGDFCSLNSALNTMESLWSCALNVSHKISATDCSCALSDFFDHLINAMNTVLLKAGEVSNYFSEKQVMNLASALGQFTQSACYDSVANLYRPQAWHRGWMSILRLLQTLLVVCGSKVNRGENNYNINMMNGLRDEFTWAKFVSTLASTSPRFQDAISGFTFLNPTVEPKPFSWELEEMQLCTSLLDITSSLGVSVSAVTPHVRRCFCRLRRYRLQTMGIVEERWLESVLVLTVRHQLSFLLQQQLPPACAADEESVVVTIERYSSVNHTDSEEQLSFDTLRSFTLRELSIIRRGRSDPTTSFSNSTNTNNSISINNNNNNNNNNNTTNMMNTPASLHSSFATADIGIDNEAGVGPHADNVQLALRLFTRHARFYLRTRCLTLWERRQLAVALEKLLHALNRLIHDVRRLENAKLTWLVENVRDELQSLIGNLQCGS